MCRDQIASSRNGILANLARTGKFILKIDAAVLLPP